MLRNYQDPYTRAALAISDQVMPDTGKLAMYFKIPSEVHFHVDLPRENSVGFILNPIRVYAESTGIRALNFEPGDIMVLDTKSIHAARALLQRRWTFFVGVTFFCPYSEIRTAFHRWSFANEHELLRSTPVSEAENIASLYIKNQEVILP